MYYMISHLNVYKLMVSLYVYCYRS